MTPLMMICLLTVACLLTMVYTTPGFILVGFKLPAAMALGFVGATIVMCIHMFDSYGEALIWSRVNATLMWWLIPSWLVLLTPYSKKVRAARAEITKSVKAYKEQRRQR
jgi:hypothetical protein